MQSNSLSIITVVLNKEETIEETLLSVISQSEPQDELIVIDGGSTDNTLNVLLKYRKYITHLISEPDNGIYDAMNKGIKLAKGEFIGIMNSGDYYVPESLNKIRFQNADVLVGNWIRFDRKRNEQAVIKISPEKLMKLSTIMYIKHQAAFVRRSIYETYGLYDSSYQICADKEFFLRIQNKGLSFKLIEEAIAVFETGGVSDKFINFPSIATESFLIRKSLGYSTLKNVITLVEHIVLYFGYRIYRAFKPRKT